ARAVPSLGTRPKERILRRFHVLARRAMRQRACPPARADRCGHSIGHTRSQSLRRLQIDLAAPAWAAVASVVLHGFVMALVIVMAMLRLGHIAIEHIDKVVGLDEPAVPPLPCREHLFLLELLGGLAGLHSLRHG